MVTESDAIIAQARAGSARVNDAIRSAAAAVRVLAVAVGLFLVGGGLVMVWGVQ